jgi:hypothetical protein
MQFQPISAGLFTISGFHPSGASAAMYRRQSCLRKSSQVGDWRGLPQTGLSTVHRFAVDLGLNAIEKG